MNDELDNLRPEVREAINRQDRQKKCDEYCPVCEDRATIRAELLRLAGECAMIPRAQLLANLAAANERAEKAEAELAALKARVADSPIASLVYGQGDLLAVISAENPDDWAGKRVRLVVEE